MEIQEFARQVVLGNTLTEKLTPPPPQLTDFTPGEPLLITEPVRPANLPFAPRRMAPKMPKFGRFEQAEQRAIAHHIMANHELQALEVMAWTLLRFPQADPDFRLGLIAIIADEQRHTRMHAERAAKLGIPFGSLPVNCYIWKKALEFSCVLDYLAGVPLVFEGANLDHSLEFAHAFERAGDLRSAALMRVIHADEIKHVRFGWEWLSRLKPDELSEYETWQKHLHWPLRPEKARGEIFQYEARKQAGLTEDFIKQMLAAEGASEQN